MTSRVLRRLHHSGLYDNDKGFVPTLSKSKDKREE